MDDSAKLSRTLNADEVSELGPPPNADAETPTTSLIDLKSQSTAKVHFPGIASSAKSAAKNFLHCTKVLGLTTTDLARKFIAPSAQEFPANSTDREFVEVKFNHLPPPRADAREQSSN